MTYLSSCWVVPLSDYNEKTCGWSVYKLRRFGIFVIPMGVVPLSSIIMPRRDYPQGYAARFPDDFLCRESLL